MYTHLWIAFIGVFVLFQGHHVAGTLQEAFIDVAVGALAYVLDAVVGLQGEGEAAGERGWT